VLNLAFKIRNDKIIKGININNVEHKLSQFADDTTMILDGSSASLNKSLEILSDFAQLSGFNVNFDKTKDVLIGKMKYS
jgi:hypothetical protein